MSVLLDLMVFFSSIVAGLFGAVDAVYLGDLSLLDVGVMLGYFLVTVWGVHEVLTPRGV